MTTASDGSGHAARAGARRLRRGVRRAPPRRAAAWCCSTATGAATPARSTWCCATAEVLVVCEVKTRSSAAYGTPLEAVTAAKAARLRRLAARWLRRARRPSRRGADRPRRRAAARARRPAARARRGGRLMAFATARTVSLHGRGRAPDRRAGRRLPRAWSRTALVGRPDASINEARDRCRAAVVNSGFAWPSTRRVTILLSPADLPKRGTALRPRDRGRGARRRPARCPPRRAGDTPCSSASSPSTGGCGRSRACCRWRWPPRRAGMTGVVVPGAAGRGGGAGARAWRCSGCGRWRQVVAAAARATRSRRRRRSRRCPSSRAAGLARDGAARGPRPGRRRRAWPTPGTPSRSPPPAATT